VISSAWKLRIPGTQTKAKAREGDVGRGDMSSTRDVKVQKAPEMPVALAEVMQLTRLDLATRFGMRGSSSLHYHRLGFLKAL